MNPLTPEPTFAIFQRGPLANAVAAVSTPGTLTERLTQLLASDPLATNRLLLNIAMVGARVLPQGTLSPVEKATYGRYREASLRLRRDQLCDALAAAAPYPIDFAVTPARLRELGALQTSFLNWRLLGQKLINRGMDRRAVLGPMQVMMISLTVERVHARFRDPALSPQDRDKLMDDFAPALLELERVLSTPQARKEEYQAARDDAKAQIAEAAADAAYAETLLKLRQNLIVPREELFAAARRHQELQKRDAEKAKEEPKEAPKAPGPRRLL